MLPEHKTFWKDPFLNPDLLMHWSGPENIAQVKINDARSWVLSDSGSTINAVTSEFVKVHSLDSSPLSDLVDDILSINRFERLFFWPLGYVIIRVQVEGVRGYNEDEVALVVPDLTAFGSRVLVIPTINQIVNVIKESKIDDMSVILNGSRISCLLAGHWTELSIKSGMTADQTLGLLIWMELSKQRREMR